MPAKQERRVNKGVLILSGFLALSGPIETVSALDNKDALVDLVVRTAVTENMSGQVPSRVSLDNLYQVASAEIVSQPVVEVEQKQSNKLVLQIGNPYVVNFDLSTNSSSLTKMDTVPYIDKNSRTQVPVRFVAEGLGETVGWNGPTQQVFVGFTEEEKTNYLSGNQINYQVDKTKIVLKIGSNKILINGVEKLMDTAPVINKNSRTMVPVRFVAEGLGETVGWNGPTQQIYIGFTSAETLAFNEMPMGGGPDINAEIEALKYIEPSFVDNGDTLRLDDEVIKFGIITISASNGIVVAIPESVYNNIDSKMTSYEKTILIQTGTYEDEIIKRANLSQYTKDPVNTQFVWMKPSGATYAFEGATGQNVYSLSGTTKTKVEYNPITGEFIGPSAEFLAAKNTVVANLKYALGVFEKTGIETPNPFDLLASEVAAYEKTGNSEGLKTFQVLNKINSAGQEIPCLIMVTSEKDGLITSAEAMKKAIDFINLVDPTLVASFSDTKLIARDMASTDVFKNYPNRLATYNETEGIIFINEPSQGDISNEIISGKSKEEIVKILCKACIVSYITEAKAIQLHLSNPSMSLRDVGINKGQFLIDWSNKYKDRISTEDYYDHFISGGLSIISDYKNNY